VSTTLSDCAKTGLEGDNRARATFGGGRSALLNAFHQEEKIEEAKQRRLPEQIAYIPKETRWARRLSWRETAQVFQRSWKAVYRSVE
jgi:transposase